jgi:hypothetical protein
MLGEKIGEEKGKIVSRKVVSVDGGQPILEVTIQTTGKLLGADCSSTVTYQAEFKPGGYLTGYGEGVVMFSNGDIATFTGNGVGKPKGPNGASSWRGCIYYETSSSKLSRLNGLACCFEHEVDDQGNVDDKSYEWK